MFGRKKSVIDYKQLGKKVVVVGLVERAEGMMVRFGRGELIETEIMDRKEKSFRVYWDDGGVNDYPPPPYGSVFLRRDGGSVVFYYIQAPDVAVPLSTPKDAIRRVKFKDLESAERFAKKIKEYNPKLTPKVEQDEEGYYYVEFPVITFDLNRDVPIREHYAKIVLRILNKSIKKGWLERWGNVLIIGGALVIMILSFLLGTGFVKSMAEMSMKYQDKLVTALTKASDTLSKALTSSEKMIEISQKILEVTSGAQTPPPPPG